MSPSACPYRYRSASRITRDSTDSCPVVMHSMPYISATQPLFSPEIASTPLYCQTPQRYRKVQNRKHNQRGALSVQHRWCHVHPAAMQVASPFYSVKGPCDSCTPVISVSVGNYERYSLARDNIGNPQLITYIATYPSSADLPSGDFLRTRARELIAQFPLLKGRVIDGRTTSPKWDILTAEELDQGIGKLVCDRSVPDLVRSNRCRLHQPLTQLVP